MEESCCTSQRKGSRRRPFQLEGEDLHAFDRIKIPITYKANQTVFYEGHASLGLYMNEVGKDAFVTNGVGDVSLDEIYDQNLTKDPAASYGRRI